MPGQGVSSSGRLACTVFVGTVLAACAFVARAHALDIVNTVKVDYRNGGGISQPPVTSSAYFASAGTAPLLLLAKSASVTDFYAGQDVVFTLSISNAGSDTAFNVTLMDTLPAYVDFVPGSASPPPDSGWAPSPGLPRRLLWSITSLGIGGRKDVTFTVHALGPGTTDRTILNEAIAYYDDSRSPPRAFVRSSATLLLRRRVPPAAPSGLTAVAWDTSVRLAWTPSTPGTGPVSGYFVYRATYAGWASSPATLAGAVQGAGSSLFSDTGLTPGAWYCYLVRAVDTQGLESADSGSVCIAAQAEPVAPPAPADVHLLVQVFDETGRQIKVLSDTHVGSIIGALAVGDGRGAVGGRSGVPVTVLLTDGTRLAWDGKDESGRNAPNGIYHVRVTAIQPDGRMKVSIETFTLTRPYERLVEEAVLVPNPAREAAWIGFRLASMSSEVEVRIYNIAGELVHRGSASGMARSYRWDLRNRSGIMVTSGLYVVVLEANDPARGAKDRAIMKLAVSRP